MPLAPSTAPNHTDAMLPAVGSAFLRLRPWIVAPALAAQACILALSPAPRRQVTALLVGFSLMLSFFIWEAFARRTELASPRAFFASLLLTLVGLSLGTLATGGGQSPLLPLLFAPVVVGFAAFGRGARARHLLGAMALVLAALAVIPQGVPFAALAAPTHRAMALVASAASLLLAWVGVTSLSDAHARTGRALALASEECLSIAEARSRAMESLGHRVAHEIKNPLTAIKGLADVMAERAESAGDRRRLEVMSGEVARIEVILRDYLSLSRPLEDAVRSPTEIGATLRPLVSLFEARADRCGVSIEAAGAPLVASVDAPRVKEAVLNLCLNALEACAPGGSVRVTWSIEDGEVVVLVADTGRGIAPEALHRVGEAFFSTREGGTGLGVRIARGVAEAHGGSLRFESAVAVGTRARLSLGATERLG